MDSFCGSRFWDFEQIWNTTEPDFTLCFEDTVLLWIPCVFFLIFGSYEFYVTINRNNFKAPWTFNKCLKFFFALTLIFTNLIELTYSSQRQTSFFSSKVLAPLLKIIIISLATLIFFLHRLKGITYSIFLAIFWFLFSFSSFINLQTILRTIFNSSDEIVNITKDLFISRTINSFMLLGLFILSCLPDIPAEKFLPSFDSKKTCPYQTATVFSRMTFWWYNSLALLGYKRTLNNNDVWDLQTENQTQYIINNFLKYHDENICSSENLKYFPSGQKREFDEQEAEKNKVNILKSLLKYFWPSLSFCCLIKITASLLTFTSPIILNYLIDFISSDEPLWKGCFYVLIIIFSAFMESMLNAQHEFKLQVTAMRIRSVLISLIFRKGLKLSHSAKRSYTLGKIVNIMALDTQKIIEFVHIYDSIISTPIQLALSLYLLWQQLGIAFIYGLLVIILTIPVNSFVSFRLKKYQNYLMKDKDKRSKMMNEILNGIKVFKLYAWEPSFCHTILDIRNKEVKILKLQAYLNACLLFIFSSLSNFIALASFAAFILIDRNNILDASKVFVSLTLFILMKLPLALFPILVSFGSMALISLNRINKFLKSEEIENIIENKENNQYPITLSNATFKWSFDEPNVLEDINIKIGAKKLVAVIGSIGSGKSSLLNAILGDLLKLSGSVNVSGSIAYVPQTAWIQNDTVRNNIIFTNPYNPDKYQKIIKACALEDDLKILPGGDLTEIGERGINLSGGQKQRVSIARALYSSSDIYLLDDPLSAVDSHVGKIIFEKVIGCKGLLKNKTRILITHRLTFIPYADEIILIKNGKILEQGTYQELLSKNGAFSEFCAEYLSQDFDDIIDEELKIIENIKQNVNIESFKSENTSTLESGENVKQRYSIQRRNSCLPENDRLELSLKNKSKLIEEEVSQSGSVKFKTYFNYIKAIGIIHFTFTILALTFSSGSNLASSLWLSSWSNDALDEKKVSDSSLRNLRLVIYTSLVVMEGIGVIISGIVLNVGVVRGAKYIHDKMLNRIFHAPMSFFDITPIGRIINRFTKDLDILDSYIQFNLRLVFSQSFRIIAAVITISLQTPFFLLVMLPISILYFFCQKIYIASSRQLKRIEAITRSPIYSHFSEAISGITYIRISKSTEIFIKECYKRIDINHTSYFANLIASRWLTIRLEFLAYSIIFFAAASAVALRGSVSPGLSGLSISFAFTITGILNLLVKGNSDLENNMVSVERCLEYTKTPIEAPWIIPSFRPDNEWPEAGKIVFNDYSLRYRPGLDLVLHKINQTFKPNEHIGIVGRTGAGKSSLVLGLFRLIEPCSGTITIDGFDITKMGLHDLRSKLTLIPQDPVLFSGTLRKNFDPLEIHTDEEIWSALELAHLKQYVESVDRGLYQEICEGGENLSAGQKQLVCLTRALLRKSKVLILDEATAAVDSATDELIQNTIRKEFSSSTIVTIAHRLNTIMDYDKVMVMDKGLCLEFDSPKTLIRNQNSLFYSLAKDAKII